MTRIRYGSNALTKAALALVMVLALCSGAFAQTTLNSTTLSSAVTGGIGVNGQQVIPLTSTSNIAVGDILFVDAEAMLVNTITPNITVTRGYNGTAGRAHASGAVVWTGPAVRFYGYEVVGVCTAANELYQPHITVTSGNVQFCQNGEWVMYRDNGARVWRPGRSDGGTTYTANGAITVQPGVSFINGTTLAMTLANPTTEQNGMIMIILSTNASAHTLTYTAGFGGGTTARDVATFGGALNDGLVIVAVNGVWWTVSTRNVTFG